MTESGADFAVFYYPYASFLDTQVPFLKAVALYFDRLYILDPKKATSGIVGSESVAPDIKLLEEHGLLVRVSPEEVLLNYEQSIEEAIRTDMRDQEFLQACADSGRSLSWTLALAKIPKNIREDPQFKPLDESMQRLMGKLPRDLAPDLAKTGKVYTEDPYRGSRVYDETRGSGEATVEYRYADYPLALGESIMLNHALFGALLHTGATPVTDDAFHNRMLGFKIQRALKLPLVRQILDDRLKMRKMRSDTLALTALMDLDLAILPLELSLQSVLEFREEHETDLQRAREQLGWIAREIRENPWTDEFSARLEHEAIPQIRRELKQARIQQDAWLESHHGHRALEATGPSPRRMRSSLAIGVTTMPIGFAVLPPSSNRLPSPDRKATQAWLEGGQGAPQNDLHYLLRTWSG